MSRNVTLGFTVFRPETLPFAAAAMQGCGLVVLEEPQTPGFEAILAGEMPTEEYILLTEFEFPQYAVKQCLLLRELHGQGARVLQPIGKNQLMTKDGGWQGRATSKMDL